MPVSLAPIMKTPTSGWPASTLRSQMSRPVHRVRVGEARRDLVVGAHLHETALRAVLREEDAGHAGQRIAAEVHAQRMLLGGLVERRLGRARRWARRWARGEARRRRRLRSRLGHRHRRVVRAGDGAAPGEHDDAGECGGGHGDDDQADDQGPAAARVFCCRRRRARRSSPSLGAFSIASDYAIAAPARRTPRSPKLDDRRLSDRNGARRQA